MRKQIVTFIFLVLMVSLASATISLQQQPRQVYNLGDSIEIPIKIIASQPISDILSIKLTCGETEIEIYKEYISLIEGEKSRDLTIPLIKEFVGESEGACSINYKVGLEEGNLSSDFTISNKVDIVMQELTQDFSPGEKIIFLGTAVKENAAGINGIIEANLSTESSSNMIYSNLVENGAFTLEINLPQNIKAGQHNIKIYTYEKDSKDQIINNGSLITNINVKQIPTNLEIILDDVKLDPGEVLKLKAILHDQTGENMIEKIYFSIKNPEGEIIEKFEKTTDEYFEHYINITELPSTWRINAYTGELTTNTAFTINEKREIKIEILNSTVLITNIGNMIYQETIDVKIGEDIKKVELNLKIGESKKFTLTAPRGDYLVQIGEETKTVGLTGKSVDVKKFAEKTFALKPFIWVFIILILGLIAYIVFRKGYKRTFFGRKHLLRPKTKSTKIEKEKIVSLKGKLINPTIPVELSLSIHGNKQTSNIINLNLKNYKEFGSGEGGIKETLTKITRIIEEEKGLIYQSADNLFFIFAPEKTRTFKNIEKSLVIIQEIIKTLEHHNKLFKQKIEYGIAIDSGDIVLKSEANTVKFTAITSLITNLKRMSHMSNKQIYLTTRIRNELGSKIKVEKVQSDKIDAYSLKDIVQKLDHSKFITGFMERLERDKKSQKESSK